MKAWKKWSVLLLLAWAVFLCGACAGKPPQEEVSAPESNQIEDYSGRYTDKQGTSDIYSSLELLRNEDGSYAVTLSIHRTAELLGTAEEAGSGILTFDCFAPDLHVAGEIAVDGGTAEVAVSESDFPEIAAGTVYRFPDGKES